MTEVRRKRGPRSAQRRGPQSAPRRRDVLTEQAERAADVPDGGYPPERSDEHLSNYHRHFLDQGESDAFFRTTRALVVAARRWRKLANERIRPTGQNMVRWETLFLLGFSGEDLTQGQLARLLSVEGPTMVSMLHGLARDGLIERRQSETDRRVTTNRITPMGKDAVGEIMRVTNAMRDDLLRDIDPAKLAVANEVLAHILRRLDEMR